MVARYWNLLLQQVPKSKKLFTKIEYWLTKGKDLVAMLNKDGFTFQWLKDSLLLCLRSMLIGATLGLLLALAYKLVVLTVCIVFLVWIFYINLHQKPSISPTTITVDYEIMWRDLANLVCVPVFQKFYENEKINADILLTEYSTSTQFVYLLPDSLTEEIDRFTLRRKIERVYSRYLGIPLIQLAKAQRVIVYSEYLILR